MDRLKYILLFLLIAFASSAQYTVTKQHLRSYSPNDFKIRLLNEKNERIKESNNNPLELNDGFQEGQKLQISGAKYMEIQIGESLQKSHVYLPRNVGRMDVPVKDDRKNIATEFNGEKINVQVGGVSTEQLFEYRNLALNPYDWQSDEVSIFPHVESNSECRNDYRFAARNAINGLTKNDAHSKWEDRSWGPEQIENPWLDIDFGRLVNIDKVVIYIRADFPHDGYWHSATIAFDDGSEENIRFEKTNKAQAFAFSERSVKSLRIKNLSQPEPLQWCALTEIEVWGKEAFPFEIKDSWDATLRSFNWTDEMQNNNDFYWQILKEKFPIESDWLMQDTDGDFVAFAKTLSENEDWKTVAQKAITQISDKNIQTEFLERCNNTKADLIDLYLNTRKIIRKEFLSNLEEHGNEYVFVKRYRFTPSFFAYTEGLSDARNEHSFTPGASLCKASVKNGKVEIETLLEDEDGVIRDPDVSYDGKRILFAWKKSYDKDDYHLYELNTEDDKITQLTFGEFHADFEGKYLPNGDIIFNSSRCEQTVDCWKTDVSNLYLIKSDGRFLRRIGFDQVQTTYPTVLDNGKIIYTRWDYNDRGQTFPQPLFTMNPDGTAQAEFYGNNSWYPTTITHARQVPGTNKVMATFCGHHTWQHGKVGIVDPSKGRQENSGIRLIAPLREEEAVRVDRYGQNGIQFQYPYPLNEEHFLVTCDPVNSNPRTPFFLYFMNAEGKREVLAWDVKMDCKQVVPLSPRKKAFVKPSRVDYAVS